MTLLALNKYWGYVTTSNGYKGQIYLLHSWMGLEEM